VEEVASDRGSDSNSIHKLIEDAGKKAIIPSTRRRNEVKLYDKTQYKKRNLVERLMNNIKQYRAIATRYDKLASMFAGLFMATLIAISDWP